jgi:hypothetical protein
MSVTQDNTIEQQRKENARDVAICKLEHRIRNHQDAYNGFPKDSIEYDCAEKFFYGYESAQKGEVLIKGFNECYDRGYAAFKPIIG